MLFRNKVVFLYKAAKQTLNCVRRTYNIQGASNILI